MPRPKKERKVCCLPKRNAFGPTSCRYSVKKAIQMTVDEYEAIRLIDLRGFTQEECSKYMQIARTTVQQIYNSARYKLGEALVEGKFLKIDGGDYILCSGNEKYCACEGCPKHKNMIIDKK